MDSRLIAFATEYEEEHSRKGIPIKELLSELRKIFIAEFKPVQFQWKRIDPDLFLLCDLAFKLSRKQISWEELEPLKNLESNQILWQIQSNFDLIDKARERLIEDKARLVELHGVYDELSKNIMPEIRKRTFTDISTVLEDTFSDEKNTICKEIYGRWRILRYRLPRPQCMIGETIARIETPAVRKQIEHFLSTDEVLKPVEALLEVFMYKSLQHPQPAVAQPVVSQSSFNRLVIIKSAVDRSSRLLDLSRNRKEYCEELLKLLEALLKKLCHNNQNILVIVLDVLTNLCREWSDLLPNKSAVHHISTPNISSNAWTGSHGRRYSSNHNREILELPTLTEETNSK